jgi:hypothetical protein
MDVDQCKTCSYINRGCAIVKYQKYGSHMQDCPCIDCILHINCSSICNNRTEYFRDICIGRYDLDQGPARREWLKQCYNTNGEKNE